MSFDGGRRAAETPAPVVLEFNDSRFFVELSACVLQFRFSNQTKSEIEDLSVSISGEYIGQARGRSLDLAPGARVGDKIQVVPKLFGEHVIDITLRFRKNGRTQVWVTQPLLKVFANNDNPSTITIDASFHAGGNIGYGLSVRDQVDAGIRSGLIRDVNDLLKQNLPETWQAVPLRCRDMRVRVLPEFEAIEPIKTASLVLPDDVSAARCLLLGRIEVRMGRKSDNDIVLRRLPRSKENDNLTLRIQVKRPHLVLALRSDGLYMVDQETTNGTKLDGEPVRGEAKLPLDRVSEIDVAGALHLRLTPFLSASDTDKCSAERYARLGPPDLLWRLAERIGLRSVLIERVDNLAREESYLIVYRWAELGRGSGNEIKVGGHSLEAHHLRIVRIGGGLWIEGLAREKPLLVEGTSVGPAWAFPLVTEMTVEFGDLQASVEEFKQLQL